MDEAIPDNSIEETEQQETAEAGPADGSRDPEDAGPLDAREDPATAQADPESQPITKWEDVDLGLPEDAAVDSALLADFGKQAVGLGLSPKQARELVRWELGAGQALRERLLEEGTAQLKKAWGGRYEARRQAALTLVSQLDRELGDGAFSKALNACGAAYQAPIVMALAHLAGRLSEDQLGRSDPDSAARPENAEEGLMNALREARRA